MRVTGELFVFAVQINVIRNKEVLRIVKYLENSVFENGHDGYNTDKKTRRTIL